MEIHHSFCLALLPSAHVKLVGFIAKVALVVWKEGMIGGVGECFHLMSQQASVL